jgi:hypothetical protein
VSQAPLGHAYGSPVRFDGQNVNASAAPSYGNNPPAAAAASHQLRPWFMYSPFPSICFPLPTLLMPCCGRCTCPAVEGCGGAKGSSAQRTPEWW